MRKTLRRLSSPNRLKRRSPGQAVNSAQSFLPGLDPDRGRRGQAQYRPYGEQGQRSRRRIRTGEQYAPERVQPGGSPRAERVRFLAKLSATKKRREILGG